MAAIAIQRHPASAQQSPNSTTTETDTETGGDIECTQQSKPIWKESIGNEAYAFKDEFVVITRQDVDTVTFSVNQKWKSDGTPMVSVAYRNIEGNERVCDKRASTNGTLIGSGSSKEYTAHCSHGYSEVGIYSYVGTTVDFDVEECEACTAPDSNYIGYYVALPCVPVCDPSPPDCFTGPVVHVADIGEEAACIYESNPIKTTSFAATDGADSVTFKIDNTWTPSTGQANDRISSLSVSYLNVAGENKCEQVTVGTDFDHTPSFQARCGSDKTTTVMIEIHGSTLDHTPELFSKHCVGGQSSNTCSYEFIVPCTDEELCPDSISSSPSAAPTPPTTVPECVEESKLDVIQTTGNVGVYPDFVPPITITAQNVDEVSFTVTQTFNKAGIPMMAVRYIGTESKVK